MSKGKQSTGGGRGGKSRGSASKRGSGTGRSSGSQNFNQRGGRSNSVPKGRRSSTGGEDTYMGARDAIKRGIGGDIVEGRHAVRELLIAGRRRVKELTLADDLDAAPILDEIVDLANDAHVPMRYVTRSKFEHAARSQGAQGVLAVAAELPETKLEDMVRRSDGPPFLLLVDGVTDPGNLGALLRTAVCAGVTGVVLPRHRAVHITPTVAKAAAGAIEHLSIASVAGLPAAMTKLTELEVWTVGLDTVSEQKLWGLPQANGPVALVLGAEGKGVSPLVRKRCDVVVTIPMSGPLDSLNVSAAGALALFEVSRAREEN